MGVIYRNGMPYGGATSTYSPTGTMAVNGIAVSQAISQLSNGIRFKGSFNASTGAIDGGSTTLTSVEEKIGDMYVCDTAGTYLSVAYEVGDSIIFKNNVAATTAPVATDLISIEKTVSVEQVLTSGTKIATVEGVDLYAQDNTKLPLAGGTMSGNIIMNGNIIYFGSESSGAFVQYSDSELNIGNQSARIHFSDSDIQIKTPGPQNFIFEPGADGANFQIKSDLKVSGDVYADKIYGYSSSSPSVEIRAGSGIPPYIKIDTSGITISAPSWSTGTGTAAYITGTSGANKIVKYSSSRRYKENIDYEIDKEKYHEDLLKFKPCRFNYKTEPGLTNLGLIAEDVEEINPELCNFEGNKVESFKDRDLLVMCILELQRKDKEINELKSRLESLETRYNVEF